MINYKGITWSVSKETLILENACFNMQNVIKMIMEKIERKIIAPRFMVILIKFYSVNFKIA